MASPTKRHLRKRTLKNAIKHRKLLARRHKCRICKFCKIRFHKKYKEWWCSNSFNTCYDCCKVIHESPNVEVKCISCISKKEIRTCQHGCCNSRSDYMPFLTGRPDEIECIKNRRGFKNCDSCGVNCTVYLLKYDFDDLPFYCSSCHMRKRVQEPNYLGIPFWFTQESYIKPART